MAEVEVKGIGKGKKTIDPEPIPEEPPVAWGISTEELLDLQAMDELCIRINKQMQRQGEKALHPYYLEGRVLKSMFMTTSNVSRQR